MKLNLGIKMSIKKVKTLKVGALHYAVERRPVPLTEGEGYGVTGRVLYDDAKLVIAEHLCEEVEAYTILHEAVHAMFCAAGVRAHDEQLIETLGGYFFNFIRDNSDFIKAVQNQKSKV
jgi:hypothetical protein